MTEICQVTRPHGVFRVLHHNKSTNACYHDPWYDTRPEATEKWVLERQPINKKTGKGWQAWREIGEYETKQKAMRAWLYASAKAA